MYLRCAEQCLQLLPETGCSLVCPTALKGHPEIVASYSLDLWCMTRQQRYASWAFHV